MSLTYKQSGVDTAIGDEFVSRIKSITKNKEIGLFGNVFDIKSLGMNDPLIVSSTDGVGTKLKLAFMMDRHDTIGIDLVAMCVNDVICHGAKPLFFIDYIGTSKIDLSICEQIIVGINEGCNRAGCNLAGGETAEMPGIYKDGEYDLAGFTVGAVEREEYLPRNVSVGDSIIALPSNGCHSNGYSLVNLVLQHTGEKSSEILNQLLTPTTIYVKSLLDVISQANINAIANITGSGLYDNAIRVIPENMDLSIDYKAIRTPEIFNWIQKAGNIDTTEMFKIFNMGVGMVLIASKMETEKILALYKESYIIGSVIAK